MINLKSIAIKIYMLVAFTAFGYIHWEKSNTTDNYFAASLLML